MICRVEEAKHEVESRLDSQRRHMVQKESILQNEIEELKVNMITFSFSFFFSLLTVQLFAFPSYSLLFCKCSLIQINYIKYGEQIRC